MPVLTGSQSQISTGSLRGTEQCDRIDMLLRMANSYVQNSPPASSCRVVRIIYNPPDLNHQIFERVNSGGVLAYELAGQDLGVLSLASLPSSRQPDIRLASQTHDCPGFPERTFIPGIVCRADLPWVDTSYIEDFDMIYQHRRLDNYFDAMTIEATSIGEHASIAVSEAKETWNDLRQLLGRKLPVPVGSLGPDGSFLLTWQIGSAYFECEFGRGGSKTLFFEDSVNRTVWDREIGPTEPLNRILTDIFPQLL